jgi:IS5 family transposase
MSQIGFFDLPDHLKRLSDSGDPLVELDRIIDFESFRPVLEIALDYTAGSKGGRPPYDPVTMFKVLILAAQNNVSDERMEFLVRDRLSWLRFLGFALGKSTPDENTIALFREKLTKAGAIRSVFDEFDRQLKGAGYLPMGGQLVDATLVSAPRQHNTDDEKAAIKQGKTAGEIWPDKPAKAAQKDTDARLSAFATQLPAGQRVDGEVLQGKAKGRWFKADRHCYSNLRLQEPHCDRPALRLHSQFCGDRCRQT